MLAGNTRDDGTPCTPDCLFNRPADRSDSFTNVAPNIGINYRPGGAHGRLRDADPRLPRAAGSRALPPAGGAGRGGPGRGVHRQPGGRLALAVAPPAGGVGRLRHAQGGLRPAGLQPLQREQRRERARGCGDSAWTCSSDLGLYASLAATWAKQTYAFSQVVTGGETITDGNDIDTAPRTLGSLRLGWTGDFLLAEAEWVHQGEYYLDRPGTPGLPRPRPAEPARLLGRDAELDHDSYA